MTMHSKASIPAILSASVLLILPAGSGCSRDVRLAGKKIRSPQVGTVEHYDVILDEDASPEKVAFVLLRAIRDDVNARSREDREAALDIQFNVCDPLATAGGTARSGRARDELVHLVVTHWAPALSYYVDGFDFDLAGAEAKMKVSPIKVSQGGQSQCSVYLPVDDPSGDPKARVYVEVKLVRAGATPRGGEKSGDVKAGYWRVFHVRFALNTRPGGKGARAINATAVGEPRVDEGSG